jgi:hypothetical protein
MDRQSGPPANLGLKPSFPFHGLSGAANSSTGSVPELHPAGLTGLRPLLWLGRNLVASWAEPTGPLRPRGTFGPFPAC